MPPLVILPPAHRKSLVPDPYWDNVKLQLRFEGLQGTRNYVDDKGHSVVSTTGVYHSTAEKRFGTSSCFFPGTSGNYATATVSGGLGAAGVPWCLEMWIYYINTVAGYIFNSRTNGTGSDGVDIGAKLKVTTASKILLNGNYEFVTGQWYHAAIKSNGSIVSSWVNGQLHETASVAHSGLTGQTFKIGGSNQGNIGYSNAYIDDLRLTSGVVRYPGAFTPPAALHQTGGYL